MTKLIIVDGLAELKLLENQSVKLKFKLFVPRAEMQTKAPMRIWSTTDGKNNMVVIGTVDFVAVSKMKPSERVPEGAVTTTYFKI